MKQSTDIYTLNALLITGLEGEADQASWIEYLKAEFGKYSAGADETKGVTFSAKTKKGHKVKTKGADRVTEEVDSISIGLACLGMATQVEEIQQKSGWYGMKADVTELAGTWKSRRDAAKAHAQKEADKRAAKELADRLLAEAEAEKVRLAEQNATLVNG